MAPCLCPHWRTGKSQDGPLVDTRRTGIVVLLQSQQHQVAGVARRKPRHLDVVVHDSLRLGKLVVLAAEKLLLVVPRRTPRQHRADVEVLAQNLPDHVLRMYAFGRILVVRTARSVDMVVARPPAVLRRIDPSLELKRKLARRVPLDGQFLRPPVEFPDRPHIRWSSSRRATEPARRRPGRPAVETGSPGRAVSKGSDRSAFAGP